MAATDKRASELTAPVSIEDADTFPGYRPGTGGEPNLDIRATAGLIRAPIIAGLASGDVTVAARGVVTAADDLGPDTVERDLIDKLAERVSIEDMGARTTNTAAENDAALAACVARATGTARIVFEVPGGRSYAFNDWYIAKSLVTICGDGELSGGTLHLGVLPYTATQSDITAYGGGLAVAMEMNLRVRGITIRGVKGSGRAGIKIAYGRELEILDVNTFDCDYGIDGYGSNGANFSQSVARVTISRFKAYQALEDIRCLKGTGNAVMHFADFTVSGCRFVDRPTGGTARTLRNARFEGIDGLTFTGNFCFMSANGDALANKAENVNVSQSTNIIIDANQLFEAGTEAVLLDRCKAFTIGQNIIAFPGQRVVSAGIRITGGDNVGDIYCIGSIGGNTIEGASGDGVKIDSGCDYVTVNPNAMAALGTSSRHYGGGSPLGSGAYAVNRASILGSTRIARQATNALQIARRVTITQTGDNQTIEIYDAKEVLLNPGSQLNVSAFTRYGVVPTDPEDGFVVRSLASGGCKIYSGSTIVLPGVVHRNMTTNDEITFVPGGDSKLYATAIKILDRTRVITTAGSALVIDIEDGVAVSYTPASTSSIAQITRNALPLEQQTISHKVSWLCTNANTTFTHDTTKMNCPGATNLAVPAGGVVEIRNINGKTYVAALNF